MATRRRAFAPWGILDVADGDGRRRRRGNGDKPSADRRRRETELLEMRERMPAYPVSFIYVLMVVTVIDAADRSALGVVLEDVKATFRVSDGQLGLLVGAYSLLATLSAMPFGVLTDRWHRVRLVALGFLPWAIAMFLTGAATSFAMMFTARMFLASIEATNGPATPSLIGDYYPASRRDQILGLFGMGTTLGTIVGQVMLGAVATAYGWRWSFIVWGVAGMGCAGLVLRVLREPERGLPDAIHRAESVLAMGEGEAVGLPGMRVLAAGDELIDGDTYRQMGLRQSIPHVLRIRTLWIVVASEATLGFFLAAISTWGPTFFRRYHDLSAAGGAAAASVASIGAIAGVVIGSRVAARQVAKGRYVDRITLSAAAYAASTLFLVPALRVNSLPVAVVFFLVGSFLFAAPTAPLQAVGLDVVVAQLRGRANALRSIARTIGMAVAPILVGVLSDSFGLRTTMLILIPLVPLSALMLVTARWTYRRDAHYAQDEALRLIRMEAGSG